MRRSFVEGDAAPLRALLADDAVLVAINPNFTASAVDAYPQAVIATSTSTTA